MTCGELGELRWLVNNLAMGELYAYALPIAVLVANCGDKGKFPSEKGTGEYTVDMID